MYINLLLGAIDAWLNTANRVGEDLTFLLRLPAHKFWSQILFDERLQVDFNFLTNCQFFYIINRYLTNELLDKYS